jgi:hypothetical protein
MKVKGISNYNNLHKLSYEKRAGLQHEQGKHRRRQRREMRERFEG